MQGFAGVASHSARTVCSWAMAFLLASALAMPAAAAPLRTVGAKGGKAKADPSKVSRRAKAAVPGGPADGRALWWNDAGIVKALSLTDEQRKKMESYLSAYRETVPEERRRAEFHEALVQGRFDEARKELEKLSQLAAASVSTRGRLKIDVLSVLSEEQHKQLVDGYPRLIYKPWGRAMRPSTP